MTEISYVLKHILHTKSTMFAVVFCHSCYFHVNHKVPRVWKWLKSPYPQSQWPLGMFAIHSLRTLCEMRIAKATLLPSFLFFLKTSNSPWAHLSWNGVQLLIFIMENLFSPGSLEIGAWILSYNSIALTTLSKIVCLLAVILAIILWHNYYLSELYLSVHFLVSPSWMKTPRWQR